MSKPKKPRGIRKAKGYKPGDISRNLYLASHAHIQGNDPVSGAAAHFLNGCKTAARLVGMSLKCADGKYEVNYSGYNREMMKPLRLKKADVDKHYFTLGLDICQRILWAIELQDGYFFKDLARLCEGPHPADIDLRTWLILAHWDIDKGTAKGRRQDHFFTAKELCEKALARKLFTTPECIPERRMHEVCCELGIKLARRKGWTKPT